MLDRRITRYKLEMRVRVSLDEPGKRAYWFGQSNDLSEYGMSLFVPSDFAVGAAIRIEFQLPGSRQKLIIRGAIRNRDSFRYGIEFLFPTAAEREQIVSCCKMASELK